MEQFNSIELALSTFFSNDNSQRKEAEKYLDSISSINFEAGIDYFLSGLDLPQSNLSELAAVYLKKQYIDDLQKMSQISTQKQQVIIQKIHSTINSSRQLLYLKRVFEILVKLYAQLNQQDQLMNLLDVLDQDNNNTIKQAVLYLIEIICEYIYDDEYLMKNSEKLSTIFQKNLEDQQVEIRVCAFKSLTIFLSTIQDERLLNKFTSVFPLLISKAIECIKSDEEAGKIALSSLNDLIETHPKFVRPIIGDLINLFTEIMLAKALNEQIRIQGLTGINILSTTSPSLVRKNDTFKTKTIQGIFWMMTEAENLQLEEWNAELNDEILSKNDPSSAAQEALGQMSQEITVKFLLQLYAPLITQGLQSNQWQHQHAALMSISMLSEGSSEFFSKDLSDLDQIMKMVIPLHASNNPRITYDILTTYSLLCSEFSPKFQTKYGNEIMTLIINSMSHNLVKLQFRAVQATINFTRDLLDLEEESKFFLQYVDSILTPLNILIQKSIQQNIPTLLEEVLTALSLVAAVIESQFSKYYNIFMPLLQQIMNTLQASNQQQINIRIKTIETMGYLLVSIKEQPTLFMQDAILTMQVLIQMQQQIEKDDPHHPSILVVLGQIVSCMKENFSQFMGVVFPRVLEAASIDIQCTFADEDEEVDKSKYMKKTFDLGMHGGKKVLKLNTSSLEQKIEGFHCLEVMSEHMGTAYIPQIEATLNLIVQFFSFTHGKEIRQVAVKILRHLLKDCSDDEQRSFILQKALDPLNKELQLQVDSGQAEDIVFLIDQVNFCVQSFKKPLIDQNQLGTLINLITKSLRAWNEKKNNIIKNYQDEEMDQELKDKMNDDIDEVGEILVGVSEFTGSILKLFGGSLENLLVNNILPDYFAILQNKDSTNSEINSACCVFCDFFDHGSDNIFNAAVQRLMPNFVALGLNNEDQDVQQTVSYGIGSIAKRYDRANFSQFLNSTLNIIQKILTHVDAQKEDRWSCTETAIGALGKIALFQSQQEVVVNNFLNMLPLKNDDEEAQNVHKMLFQEVLKNNNCLTGNQNVLANVKNCLLRIKQYLQSNPEQKILDEEGAVLLNQLQF